MTDNEMRIAVAECCGWKFETSDNPLLLKVIPPSGVTCKRTFVMYREDAIPDYPNDLNAMHEAIMSQPKELRMKANEALMNLIDAYAPYCLDRTINATARQRCEAFLRTLGKWKDLQ